MNDGRLSRVSQFYSGQFVGPARWMSYWHQLDQIMRLTPSSVLEIGLGNAVVSDYLRRRIPTYYALDIDPSAPADIFGSVTSIPFADQTFDVILCAEVLEHLPFNEFRSCLIEMGRVAKKNILLSLPQSGARFSVILSFPGINRFAYGMAVSAHRKHAYNGLHYWEIGWKGYTRKHIRQQIQSAGFKIEKEFNPVEMLYNRFYLIVKDQT